jgi:heat-inducible transcriptional repressor
MNQEIVKDLTSRQIQILKAIIEEYIATAEPVGSETLDKKHNLGVSPATIRNEMVKLTSMNLLKQPHTSSGRTPTPIAMKYYVENLMKTKDMSVTEEVAVKEKIWDYRQEIDKLLREATKTLAEKTQTLALTATNEGDMYYAGMANILEMPEFYDFQLTQHVFSMLDRFDFWWSIMSRNDIPFNVLLGEDMGDPDMRAECGFIYAKFTTPHLSGAIGIVGPSRLNYSSIIPNVRFIGSLIDEFGRNW